MGWAGGFRAISKTCRRAADGTVLHIAETMAYRRNHGVPPKPWRTAETMAMQQGREFVRQSLQTALTEEAREVEKKGRRVGHVRVD